MVLCFSFSFQQRFLFFCFNNLFLLLCLGDGRGLQMRFLGFISLFDLIVLLIFLLSFSSPPHFLLVGLNIFYFSFWFRKKINKCLSQRNFKTLGVVVIGPRPPQMVIFNCLHWCSAALVSSVHVFVSLLGAAFLVFYRNSYNSAFVRSLWR